MNYDTLQYIAQRLTPVYGRGEAMAMARWMQEEADGSYDTEEVLARLEKREPIQYVFGHTDWMSLHLSVCADTLIPRPETAELIEAIGGLETQEQMRVLDIGTGSGCIAIALKKQHPEWMVSACDISQVALRTAQQNAEDNGAEVQFFSLDILHDELPEQYDLIVSNPPYICEEERASMDRNVLDYEPDRALFVPDDDPLVFYRRIARLQPKGYVCFEINERFGQEMISMLLVEGYKDIKLLQDICGKDRIVIGRR